MKTEWKEESCNVKPEIFQKLNDTTYMQRKKIQKEETTDENGEKIIRYHCLSRFISKDIYDDFVDALDDPAQLELVNEINMVKDSLQENNENTILMMNAIANIYELTTLGSQTD